MRRPRKHDSKTRERAPDGYQSVTVSPGNLIAVHEEVSPLVEKLTQEIHRAPPPRP